MAGFVQQDFGVRVAVHADHLPVDALTDAVVGVHLGAPAPETSAHLDEYLDLDQIRDLRSLIVASTSSKRPGPRPTNDLKDAVDLILGTGGCRIGEAGALIYPEIDLGASKPTLTVSGTIITDTGVGTFRQPWTDRPLTNFFASNDQPERSA